MVLIYSSDGSNVYGVPIGGEFEETPRQGGCRAMKAVQSCS